MNILSFDVESNGLHGAAFAVAGVLISPSRNVLSSFVARCPIIGEVDGWVAENVLGPMETIESTHKDARSMRDAFWGWYVATKPRAGIIVAANPYPVEARFLIDCQNDDLPNRSTDHPFPFYDLSSMLFMIGAKTPPNRREFTATAVDGLAGAAHDPQWDALATAISALAAINLGISKVSATPQILTVNPKASV
jgi:hypothetical protein